MPAQRQILHCLLPFPQIQSCSEATADLIQDQTQGHNDLAAVKGRFQQEDAVSIQIKSIYFKATMWIFFMFVRFFIILNTSGLQVWLWGISSSAFSACRLESCVACSEWELESGWISYFRAHYWSVCLHLLSSKYCLKTRCNVQSDVLRGSLSFSACTHAYNIH